MVINFYSFIECIHGKNKGKKLLVENTHIQSKRLLRTLKGLMTAYRPAGQGAIIGFRLV